MSVAAQRVAPTVNDLKVKVCYVCQDEERYDSDSSNTAAPSEKPQTWVHPCKCTLVAHEQCLLRWIRTAQSNKPNEPVKCPQCGFHYEWESDAPLIFRVLDAGNSVLEAGGKVMVAGLLGTVLGGTFAGTFVMLTAYGAHAIYQFFGKEMFDLTLTSNYRQWPYAVYANLPTIPILLLASRTGLSNRATLETILGMWPAAQPALQSSSGTRLQPGTVFHDPWQEPRLWPPPPSLYGIFIIPMIRSHYRAWRNRIMNWILGDTDPTRVRNSATELVLQIGAMPLFFRIQEREDRRREAERERQGIADEEQPVQQPADAVPVVENAPQLVEDEVNAPGTRNVSLASIGRFVGGALLIPTLASTMGSLLLRLSKYSPPLRRFLAIRGPLTPLERRLTSYGLFEHLNGSNITLSQILFKSVRHAVGIALFGYGPWGRADPVWFRNSIGLGLFVLVKDAINLFHIYLAKRELATRRVKNRDFSEIDPSTLDLINPSRFVRAVRNASGAPLTSSPEARSPPRTPAVQLEAAEEATELVAVAVAEQEAEHLREGLIEAEAAIEALADQRE